LDQRDQVMLTLGSPFAVVGDAICLQQSWQSLFRYTF